MSNLITSAFSTVVAEGQFSTLGSVLIAALAQARDATPLGVDQIADSSNDVLIDQKANESYAGDLGVRIGRPTDRPTETPVEVKQKKTSKPLLAAPVPRQESSIPKPKKSKSKAKKAKSANAIDDIFNFID
jgi:ribonuclease MRP protein subunit RMP1